MRRAKARKRRHQIDATIIGHAARKRFSFGGMRDEPQIIAQPLDKASGDKYRPFKRIMPLAM